MRTPAAMRALEAAIIVAAVAFAGCAGGSQGDDPIDAGSASDTAPTLVDSAARPDRPHKAETPHVHDYWFGAMSIVLLDETVPVMIAHNHMLDEPPREQHTHGCDETLASKSQGGSRKFSLPPGSIVLPGTEALEFLFEWNSPSITGLRLLYRPGNGHDFEDAGALTRGKILRLNLTPEMSDAGHTTQTKWAFFLCADSEKPLDTAEGAVRTNILALRAPELPLEPPHPDAWGNAAGLAIAQANFTTTAATALNKGDGAWLHIPIEHGTIVPPGTTSVKIFVNATGEGATGSLRPENLLAYYRDASVPEWVYRTANATTLGGTGLLFEIPVDHDMVDGVYAHETTWDLWLRVVSATRAPASGAILSAPYAYEGTISAFVQAERVSPGPFNEEPNDIE